MVRGDVVVLQTLQNGINLHAVNANLGCIITKIDALPDTSVLISFSQSINASLFAAKPAISDLTAQVTSIFTSQHNITDSANALLGITTALSVTLAALQTGLGQCQTALSPLAAAQVTLTTPTTGLLPSIQADLSVLQPDVGLPNATFVLLTSGPDDITDISGTGTLNRLFMGVLNNSVTELSLLASRLASINATTAPLHAVNFSRTADRVTSLNTLSAQIKSQQIPALLTALTDTEAAVAALPVSGSILPFVYGMYDAGAGVPFPGVVDGVNRIQAIVNGLPNITELLTLLDTVASTADVVPCALNIMSEVRNFNATIMQLPPSLTDALHVIDDANATVTDALAQVVLVKVRSALEM